MSLIIRSEQISDYAAIAEVNALAFGKMEEAILVDMLRHDARFDPALSLVAERDGNVIGHALFVVYNVWLDGTLMPAAELAPLAVHPDFQRQGLGQALLRAALERLRERGVQFAFHYGHASYYPRVGYRTHMFGECAIQVARADLPVATATLSQRAVERRDIPTLLAMGSTWFHGIDMVREPLASITDWWSSHPAAKSLVLVGEDDAPRAYVRYRPESPFRPKGILAGDGQALLEALILLSDLCEQETEALILPLHPDSPATAMLSVPWAPRTKLYDAGMMLPLAENAQVTRYMQEVAAGERLPGLVLMPPIFDLF